MVKVAERGGCPNEWEIWHKQQGGCARCALVCQPAFREAKPGPRAMMLIAEQRKHKAVSSK